MNIKYTLLAAAMLPLLAACGGSGSDKPPQNTEPKPTPPAVETTHKLNGAAIKGPLSNAQVSVYSIDLSDPEMIGKQISVGTTDQKGSLDISIIGDLAEHYIITVSATDQTIDISTGITPSIKMLSAMVSKSDIETKNINISPLTTMAVHYASQLAADNDSISDVYDTYRSSGKTILTQLGFGIDENFDIYHAPAALYNLDQDLASLVAHRTTIEAVSALTTYISDNYALAEIDFSTDDVLKYI